MKQWEFDERWKQGMKDLAEEAEGECGDWQNSEGLSDRARGELFARIGAEEAKEANVRPFRLRKRYIPVIAAVLVLACGMGAVGSRVWRSDSDDLERDTTVTTKVNNETKEAVLLEEEEIYQEIVDKLGIAALRMGYMPGDMTLDGATIKENVGWADIYYLYNENLIVLKMSKKSLESSGNVQWDGESRKLELTSSFFEYEIEAYCTDEEEHLYAANVLYGNGYYAIFGKFEDENEFLRILEEIYFKKV